MAGGDGALTVARRAEPPVRALVGPTGAGKTTLALEAAARIGAEVVAVDAFTVYRGMDVGTAKPSAADRARVPHHLVDVLDPGSECTVQWFQRAAREAVTAVRARGAAPLLVGGSGLYFRAVVDPLEFPPTDPAVRAAIVRRWAGDPSGAHAALRALDPDAAARIDEGNLRRVVRALEVVELTGGPFSAWRRAWDRHRSVYPELTVVGLRTDPARLATRIDARVDAMLRAGLVDECRALLDGPLSATARQAIGYAEVFEHLAGRCTLDEGAERIRVRTRRYAARQTRWFRADPRVRWMAPDHAIGVLAS
ncbi:tRNA (adenosine(37)-N6)-dimethylallyltransferase MiaA [soil metagenome]